MALLSNEGEREATKIGADDVPWAALDQLLRELYCAVTSLVDGTPFGLARRCDGIVDVQPMHAAEILTTDARPANGAVLPILVDVPVVVT